MSVQIEKGLFMRPVIHKQSVLGCAGIVQKPPGSRSMESHKEQNALYKFTSNYWRQREARTSTSLRDLPFVVKPFYIETNALERTLPVL